MKKISKRNKESKRGKESNLERQISEILENFDFDRVSEFMNWDKAYREYDDDGVVIDKRPWKTLNKHHGFSVPTPEELKEDARYLLNEVIKRRDSDNHYSIRTGPFEARYNWGILTLNCIIESWDEL